MRTARIAAVLLAFVLAAIAWGSRDRGGEGLHVSGDGADDLAVRLGSTLAATAEAAATEVVLLRRWQNLDHAPALRRLCRGACAPGTAAVAIRQPSPSGLRRVLLIDVGALGAGPSLDRGEGLPDAVVDCLTQGVTARAALLCGAPVERVWRLPGGL